MDSWRPWPDVVVRGTGFPVSALLDLADPVTAETALTDDPDSGRLRESWHEGIRRTGVRLLLMAEEERFRTALLWQNPAAIDGVVGWLRRHEDPYRRNQDRRRKEATLARYAQRYHARNETIGFFGPYSWAVFDDDVPYLEASPGPGLVARRSVHFEDWAIDAVAAALAEDPALRRRFPAARLPGVAVTGTLVIGPDGAARRLTAMQAAVLAAVDGTRIPRDITADLRWRGTPGVRGEDEVLAALGELQAAGLIAWRPDVPQDAWPERALRDRLTRAAPHAVPALDRLESHLSTVESAAGKPEALEKALAALDADLAALIGAAPIRAKDQRPTGRRAVYEECERDLRLSLGAGLRDALVPPMSLVLTSARWLTWRFGTCLEALVERLYGEIAETGRPLPLGLLVRRFLDLRSDQSWYTAAAEEFQRVWHEVLAYEPGARRVTRTVADLAPSIREHFAAPFPGWYGAAFHSPDVMIAARGAAEARAGRFELVLGEMHPAMVTVDSATFAEFHPDPARLRRLADAGPARHPRVVPLYPRSGEFTGRDYPTPELYSDRYWYMSFAPGNGQRAAPAGRRLELADLIAQRDPDDPSKIVVPVPGGARLGVLDVFGEIAQEQLGDLFRPLAPHPHTPRVTVDRLVIAREAWRVPAVEIPGWDEVDEAAAYVRVRRWARDLGMPRFVFWRAGLRQKPVYLDFDSPLLVGVFLAGVRRSGGVVAVMEMHPDPHHAWLPGGDGRACTSELRLVFTDPLA
ncbi:lantibiotic dehydratase [Sphaerisporangium viridialbum]|uniref:lantibiotic dehydratase n=1 Tax=Sphaerisporangium viridialbum TaxID=46189 RepID=UPI003C78C5B0